MKNFNINRIPSVTKDNVFIGNYFLSVCISTTDLTCILYSHLNSVWFIMDHFFKVETHLPFQTKVFLILCSLNCEQYNSITVQAAIVETPSLWSNVGGWTQRIGRSKANMKITIIPIKMSALATEGHYGISDQCSPTICPFKWNRSEWCTQTVKGANLHDI